jgi:hypothetical protein
MISKLVEVRIHVMMARTMPHRRPHRRLLLESGMSVMLRRPTLNNSSVTLVLMTESLSFLCSSITWSQLKIVKQLTAQPKCAWAWRFLGRYSHLSCWGRATIERAGGP